jgi:4-diphosphocytidyl-2-C-methyl-D-erythritol kinase
VPEVLRGRAPAKVNLVLEVLGRRPDGYHEIDTILQELELADTVTIAPAEAMTLKVSGPYAPGTPADASNLAWKAFELAAARARFEGRAAIHLDKQIPAAGGLGGGASDAACVLRLVRAWMPALTDEDILGVANSIGSDEAFFLAGGTARATGRGEHVTRLPTLAQHDVVLFVPNGSLEKKTARMFKALGQTPFDTGSVAAAFADRPSKQLFSSTEVFNAFERVALDLFPGLAQLWQEIEVRIELAARLAGAGPTLFWIGPPGEGPAIARACRGVDCTVIETRTATA